MRDSHIEGRTGVRALLIINPVADSGAALHAWDNALPVLEEFGLEITRTATERRGHAVELAGAHGTDAYDMVVAVGGDGTVFEVANGLMSLPRETRPALGVLPAGKCADFCRSVGIPLDVKEAARLLASGDRRMIDIGEARYRGTDGDGSAYFVNVAGVGLEGEARFQGKELSLSVDGVGYRARANTLAVANGKYYSCGMKIAPGADPADGVFDVVVMGSGPSSPFIDTPEGKPAPRRWAGQRTADRLRQHADLKKVNTGDHMDLASVGLLHGAEVKVDSPDRVVLQTEGEALGALPCTFRLLPAALEVVAPVS